MPMSRPHYGWWGYVKDIIRRYPTLCEQEKALHETCISPDLNGMPHGSGTPTDPVADAALRELPEQEDMEIVGRKNIVVFFILPSGWYFSVIRQMASACFLTGRRQGKGCYS